MSLYGELDFSELGLDFAHYTARRGRSAKIHTMQEMPKKFWLTEITDNPKSYLHIVENGDLKIAPTMNAEVELPLTFKYKFEDQDQCDEVREYLLDFDLDVNFIGLEGEIRLSDDGTVSEEAIVEEDNLAFASPEEEVPEAEAVVRKSSAKVRQVSSDDVWKLFGITYGDRLLIKDAFGWELGEYIVTVNKDTAPIIRNVKTEKEYDLFYLTGTKYQIITGS